MIDEHTVSRNFINDIKILVKIPVYYMGTYYSTFLPCFPQCAREDKSSIITKLCTPVSHQLGHFLIRVTSAWTIWDQLTNSAASNLSCGLYITYMINMGKSQSKALQILINLVALALRHKFFGCLFANWLIPFTQNKSSDQHSINSAYNNKKKLERCCEGC